MNSFKITLSIIVVLFGLTVVKGQDLMKHRWKNRVIVIMVTEKSSSLLSDQLEVFKQNQAGLEERKLVIYQATPDAHKLGMHNDQWSKDGTLYTQHKLSTEPFEVILIGLDGHVKKRQAQIFTTEQLFPLIDEMPMRQIELRNDD